MHRTFGRSGVRGSSLTASVGCCRAELGRSAVPDLLPTPFRRTSDRARVPPGAAAYHALDRHHDPARSRCLFSLSDRVRRPRVGTRIGWGGDPAVAGRLSKLFIRARDRASLASQPIHDVERSSLAPGDRRPPYNIVTLAVVEYRHLGVAGELRLVLFNDRLMNVWFYPIDVDAYMAALKSGDVAVAADRADERRQRFESGPSAISATECMWDGVMGAWRTRALGGFRATRNI